VVASQVLLVGGILERGAGVADTCRYARVESGELLLRGAIRWQRRSRVLKEMDRMKLEIAS
jgi:hypothetical protein